MREGSDTTNPETSQFWGGDRREEPSLAVRLALDQLSARRPDLALNYRWFESLGSTMDEVARAATSGAPAGLIVIAGQQTAGRGRRGRAWASPPGAGLYFSYLARPTRHVGLVTLAAGVGVREGVSRATGLEPQLKWPNDLLMGTRKLAGVLAEGSGIGTPDASVTIGVGINLRPAAYPPDVAARATSLESELGAPAPAAAVLVDVLERLADRVRALDADRPGDILHAWRAASPSAVDTPVTWSEDAGIKSGVTAGIDDDGALLVRTPAGIERVVGGELHWELTASPAS